MRACKIEWDGCYSDVFCFFLSLAPSGGSPVPSRPISDHRSVSLPLPVHKTNWIWLFSHCNSYLLGPGWVLSQSLPALDASLFSCIKPVRRDKGLPRLSICAEDPPWSSGWKWKLSSSYLFLLCIWQFFLRFLFEFVSHSRPLCVKKKL